MDRIVQDGFASEFLHQDSYGNTDAIFFPVTGHLVMLKGKPETMRLYDDYTRLLHSMSNVAFLWSVSSPLEGKKKCPRPYVFEKAAGSSSEDFSAGDKLLSVGEKLKISYIGGNVYNPLVEGAIEHLSIINQKEFLRLDATNLERQPERYENDDYLFEFENDGRGEFVWHITAKEVDSAKANVGGTGNITLNLTGLKEHGNITLNLNGKVSINQRNADGQVIQTALLDNTEKAERVLIEQKDSDGNVLQRLLLDNTEEAQRIALEQNDGAGQPLQWITLENLDREAKVTVVDKNLNRVELFGEGVRITDKTGSMVEMLGDGVTVTDSRNKTSVVSGKIALGKKGGATYKIILGEPLHDFLRSVLNELKIHIHPDPQGGFVGPMVNASALDLLAGTLPQTLSRQNTTE